MIKEQQKTVERIRGQIEVIRKERYRIARECKYLQTQDRTLKDENLDIR